MLDKVGIDDSFFDLGGHSLLLIRMLIKLKSHFERELCIIDFFRYPSIRKLGEYLINIENESSALTKVSDVAEKQKKFLKKQQQLAQQRRSPDAR